MSNRTHSAHARPRQSARLPLGTFAGTVACLLVGALLTACQSSSSVGANKNGQARLIRSADARTVRMEDMARDLAQYDVVFLGENHSNTAGHALQMETTRQLQALRPDIVISMEMFERDAQGVLNQYLRGECTEAEFLARSRPWPNYQEHYRPAIEFARAQQLEVLAANIPRRLAARVAKQGLDSLWEASESRAYAPREIYTWDNRYKDQFALAMGGHGGLGVEAMNRYFAAQCLKDDAMAESIADRLRKSADEAPLIVHWCGGFHSRDRLGTVERLQVRMPDLRIAVVEMQAGDTNPKRIHASELATADYYWLVPPDAQ